jgi:hypothetical protein
MAAIKGSPNSSYLMMLRTKKAMASRATILKGILDFLETWINV